MYDINFKNLKKGRRFYYIPIAAGIFFMALMLGIYISTINKSKKMDKSTMATNIEVTEDYNSDNELEYSPVYYYEVEGKEYRCASSSSSTSYPDTSSGLVYYNSNNPSECMTEYTKSSNGTILIFLIIPIIFILVGIVSIIKVNKKIKIVKELNKTGKLIKNIPYALVPSGNAVNGEEIQKIAIEYPLPSGSKVTLYGDPRFDKKLYDNDGMVDLLIDENNIENYFIDFEINRLSGNLPEDYNKTIKSAPQVNPYGEQSEFLNKIKDKFNN